MGRLVLLSGLQAIESTGIGKTFFLPRSLSSCFLEQSCISETVLDLAGLESRSGELCSWRTGMWHGDEVEVVRNWPGRSNFSHFPMTGIS